MCQSLVAYGQAKRMFPMWPSSRPRLCFSNPLFFQTGLPLWRTLFTLSVTVLFVVLSKKAMWGHTCDACIRGTQVESEGGERVLWFPILFNIAVIKDNSGISRQPVNMTTEPIFAIWEMSGPIPFKLHSLDTPAGLLKKIYYVLVRPLRGVCNASFSAAQSDQSD